MHFLSFIMSQSNSSALYTQSDNFHAIPFRIMYIHVRSYFFLQYISDASSVDKVCEALRSETLYATVTDEQTKNNTSLKLLFQVGYIILWKCPPFMHEISACLRLGSKDWRVVQWDQIINYIHVRYIISLSCAFDWFLVARFIVWEGNSSSSEVKTNENPPCLNSSLNPWDTVNILISHVSIANFFWVFISLWGTHNQIWILIWCI